jgi:hypothetical protein
MRVLLLLPIAIVSACAGPDGSQKPVDSGADLDSGTDSGADSDDDSGGDSGEDTGQDSGELPFDPDPRCPVEDGDIEQEPIYKHRVDRLISADGLSFTLSDDDGLSHASVPDAFLMEGEIWAYVVDGTQGRHGIWAARHHGGLVLQDCVLVDDTWDRLRVDPDVVSTDDGLRLYWLQGSPPDQPEPATRQIWTALSSDGVTYFDAELAIETGSATDPSVARGPDGLWWMAYSVRGGTVALATSVDGRTFTETDTQVEGTVPELHATDGGLRLYTTRGEKIYSSVSADGQTWTDEPEPRWIPGFAPSVLTVEGETWMWVASQERDEASP